MNFTPLEMEDTNISIRPTPSKHTIGSQRLTLSQHIVIIIFFL